MLSMQQELGKVSITLSATARMRALTIYGIMVLYVSSSSGIVWVLQIRSKPFGEVIEGKSSI